MTMNKTQTHLEASATTSKEYTMRFQIIIQHHTGPNDIVAVTVAEYDTVIEAAPKLRKVLDAWDQGEEKFLLLFSGVVSIELWMNDNRTGRICLEQY